MNIIRSIFIRIIPTISGFEELKIVVCQGQVNDYACYIGCGNIERIAQEGAKLTEDEFKRFYPKVYDDLTSKNLKYRA